ncbi:VpsF family polysaccharide biosynthesis protein [Mesorhizobium sp. YC-39]|uniref:VpsF family polysaccharide biosynthesis protein n=1 Tax=Mesorhizobium sp. YC-39 TaxID=2986065 RepID=UPI0021E96F79|nr:VpsF family polysaccharide biosynthesis protein [Mesorhizobium sp. YC-39]MCV3231991.1 VpsF family polysaccharide biosynthesis protein [Mesorhizobium sp. YC-39]
MLRFTVSPQIMNMVVDYTAQGGSFYEKLHLGTYAIFLLLAFVLFSRPFLLRGDEIGLFKALMRYSALTFALVPYLFITGRAGSSGFIIDTYLVAGAAGLLMLALNADVRRALGDVVLGMAMLSAVIGTIEALTHHRLLPYGLNELQFRPTGLSAHPLALGALCATAIGFVPLTHWRIWVRVMAIFVLFVGCAASGARAALMLATGETLILLLFVPWPRLTLKHQRQAKTVVLLFTLAGGALLLAVLVSGGLLNRFSNTIFDENFMARVTIYKVFGLVSWKDILFGMNVDDLLAIVREKLHLPYIESAPVVIVMLFGLPIALLFTALIFWFIFRLLRGAPLPAWIGTITFLLAALSNNALSSKTPEMTIIVVLLLAYRNPPEVKSSTAVAAKPKLDRVR